MPSLPSVSYQFCYCFSVYVFVLHVFCYDVINPGFSLSFSNSHTSSVAMRLNERLVSLVTRLVLCTDMQRQLILI